MDQNTRLYEELPDRVEYNEKTVRDYAQLLYELANFTVAQYSIAFGLGFGLLGAVGFSLLSRPANMSAMAVTGFVTVGVGGLILGSKFGDSKAVFLRLKAQEALCKVQIERNTRKGE